MTPHWPIFYDGFSRLLGEDALEGLIRRLKLDPHKIDPVFGLTDLQLLSIYLYTTPLDYYLRLNSALRDWQPSPAAALPIELLIFALGLENALRKLPIYKGLVYRGIRHPAPLADRRARFVEGAVLQWKSFTSCTREAEQAYPGNTLFIIQSRSGRSLASVTADDDHEIIFSAFTSFHVLNVVVIPDDKMVVVMKEAES